LIEKLARREVAASRLDPSQVTYATLGPFITPDYPNKAAAWDDGAHIIAIYHHRYDMYDEANPLGRQPGGASARAERARAQRRVQARNGVLAGPPIPVQST
jgi:hypothetical protein